MSTALLIGATGLGAETFTGVMDNVDVFKLIRAAVGL